MTINVDEVKNMFKWTYARERALDQLLRNVTYCSLSYDLLYDEDTDKLVTIDDNRNTTLLGLGYNSGAGLIGYEILVLYDFNVAEDDDALPFDFRVGFTYKF